MRVKLVVSGLVQGVGFRYYSRQMAQGLGVTGWVMNNPDDTVSIEAEADRVTLERFISLIEKGPTYSDVRYVDKVWYDTNKGYHYFMIKT